MRIYHYTSIDTLALKGQRDKGPEGQVHWSAEGQRNLSYDSRFAHKINKNKRILQKVNPLGRDLCDFYCFRGMFVL